MHGAICCTAASDVTNGAAMMANGSQLAEDDIAALRGLAWQRPDGEGGHCLTLSWR